MAEGRTVPGRVGVGRRQATGAVGRGPSWSSWLGLQDKQQRSVYRHGAGVETGVRSR